MDDIYKQIEYKLHLLQSVVDDNEIKEISQDFQMIYTDAVVNKHSRDELLEALSNGSIIDRMDKILEGVENNELISQYKSIDIPMNIKSIQVNICEYCRELMIQTYDKTSYVCICCNLTKPVHNSLIDISQNIPRSKIGNFNPERHFKTWIDRILAKESEDELKVTIQKVTLSADEIIQKIKESLISRSKSIEHITIDDIRLILKELKMTTLNKNTSLIAKKITGRSPPNITDDQYMHVHSLFVSVMEARDNISDIIKCNRIYYPYYIVKILDIILTDVEQRKILNYIHLHKETTLSSNDLEWAEICNIVPILKGKYQPTLPSSSRYI